MQAIIDIGALERSPRLSDKAQAKRRDYVAEHMFLTMPGELEYVRGTLEMAEFCADGP